MDAIACYHQPLRKLSAAAAELHISVSASIAFSRLCMPLSSMRMPVMA